MFDRSALFLCAAALVLAACEDPASSADDAGPGADARAADSDSGPPRDAGPVGDAGPDPGTPCEIRELVQANCQECHSDPPRFGAPMPLVTPAQFRAPAASDPSRSVGDLALERVRRSDGSRMPPAPRDALSTEEISALDAWVAAGAMERTSAESCAPPPVTECIGPECLPCTPSVSVRAHGADPSMPFEVPADESNAYRCFAFPSPFRGGMQAIAWAPVIGDARVVHHLLMYRTQTAQSPGPMPCEMPLDAVGMLGWAPGTGNIVLPDDVGLETTSGGAEEWLILQVHYYNVAGLKDARDQSGFSVCTVDTPRANTAGVLTLGSTSIAIPPRARAQEVAGLCPATSTALLREPLHVLADGPHMHQRGSRFMVEVLRGGFTPETVLDVDPYRFDDQRAWWHETPYVIRPGDAVRTRCIYDNPSEEWAYYGERTEDEMCFDFAIVYPIDAIPAGYARTCVLTLGF